ncbi:flagellar protein FliT [Paraburkholderia sp. HP33-1]|uniref:flagellar protein FliT n=1 Tax=Paraburkholderia sp. HP33-1 TaxID=2883243 RepID=UPI001F32B1A5|nr:flagellar protein FliT [Paraburkholderia sp. HP33-1]
MSAERMEMSQAELVGRVFDLTEAISLAGQLADWQRAAGLAEERSQLVRSIRREQDAESLQLIGRILEMNGAIANDARTYRDELTIEYQAAVARTQAAQQYNRVALF